MPSESLLARQTVTTCRIDTLRCSYRCPDNRPLPSVRVTLEPVENHRQPDSTTQYTRSTLADRSVVSLSIVPWADMEWSVIDDIFASFPRLNRVELKLAYPENLEMSVWKYGCQVVDKMPQLKRSCQCQLNLWIGEEQIDWTSEDPYNQTKSPWRGIEEREGFTFARPLEYDPLEYISAA